MEHFLCSGQENVYSQDATYDLLPLTHIMHWSAVTPAPLRSK